MAFEAIVATESGRESVARVGSLEVGDLPKEPVLVEVSHSALNYKDALAICGNRNKIMKSLPFVPGIDLAGTVVESSDPAFLPGDEVVATGFGMGERHWGGFARFARLKPEWLCRLPRGLSRRHSMALGTAGLTAMLCVEALERGGVGSNSGEILVTGASGGVGSLSVMLLASRGYSVVASTGKPEQGDYLSQLGAARIVSRGDFDRDSRPLEKEVWAGAIDTVGGRALATVLAETKYGGVVAACGLAGGFDLPATVMPFILRGVALQGIDSVYFPSEKRSAAWQRLGASLSGDQIDSLAQDVGLADLPVLAEQMLAGKLKGRAVVVFEATE